MAKMRFSRKATKGKGKRWKKGASSSSNPEHKKFRNSAKRGYLNTGKGSGNLTQELLAKHNAFEGRSRSNSECSDATDGESIGAKTFDTFASGFSNCSNPSFNRLMKNWQSCSFLHKEMLAILAAVAETIKEKGGKETETEYFAALMLTLETVESDESQSAVVGLIGMVIKRLPPSVLKIKFSDVSKVFVSLLGRHANSDHVSLLRSLIGCLSVLLRAQDLSVWKNPSTLHIFNTVLSFSTHPKPKVRKAGQHAVCSILKGSSFLSESVQHPATTATAKFCVLKIEEAGGSSQATTTLHVLGMLKDLLGCFPKQEIKTVCETLLRVMLLSSPLVKCCSLNALGGLFRSKPKQMTDELAAQLINALYDYQPGSNDNQSLVAWLTTMHLALVHLKSLNSKLCLDHTVKFFGCALDCCLSDKEDVVNTVISVLKDTLTSCVGPCVEQVGDIQALTNRESPLHKLILFLENGLKYQFHAVWGNLLQVMAVAFKCIGKQCHSLFTKILQSLAELRDTPHFAFTCDLDRAMGAAVRAMGPQVVLRAIPINIHVSGKDRFDFPRSWLIPVIRDNVQETKLQFFTEFFLPLANQLRNRVFQLEKEDRKIEAKTVDILQVQIWSMLPGFCTKPTDLTESFRAIAKTMGLTLAERPDLRLHILAAIRNLINKNTGNVSNQQELAKFAKNFLPILFNVYTSEPNTTAENHVRLAVFDTIKVYLKITDTNLSCELFDKIVLRLEDNSSVTAFNRHAVLDLSRALLPYTRAEHVLKIYNICKSFLQNEDRKLQKKAYRVMEEVFQNENANCVKFVSENISQLQDLLLSSINKANPSSKAPRLRCLTKIVSHLSDQNPEFMEALIPEAVLCVKESAEKVRSAAFSLLLEIGRAQQRLSSNANEAACIFISHVMGGLAGNPHVMSATLSALAGLFYHFRGQLSSELTESMIINVCLLLEAKCREVVQSALAFMKTLLDATDVEDLAQYLPAIVKGLTSSSEDCQRHFRFKVKVLMTRLIRKFGYEIISKLVPNSHQKILANIRKIEARKARDKTNRRDSKSDDDDEEEDHHKPADDIDAVLHDLSIEDDEPSKRPKVKAIRGRRKNKSAAYIEEAGEEIVDFMDHKVSQKITAVRPSEKEDSGSKHGFKTAPDGRLIITDNDDDDKKKKKSSESMDYLIEAAEFAKKGQKRTRSADSDDDEEPALHPGDRKGIHRKNPRNTQDGSSYKAKKAKGDVKKKDKHDPYAYIPLDRQALNKRKKAKIGKELRNVVRGAKKGAAKGTKFKGKRNRQK